MVTLTDKIILSYLPTASGFRPVFSSNFLTACAKGRYRLLKELEKLEQLKYSPNTKCVAANKFNNNK